MKLARPKLSTDLEDVTLEIMIDDGELEAARLHGENGTNCNVAALHLIDALAEGVQFTGAHFSRIIARDVVFKQVDFSSAHLDNGMLVRVEFINCRMTGTDFSYTSIHDVTFKDCKLDKANFYKADLRRVEFIGCNVQAGDLVGVNQVGVSFR